MESPPKHSLADDPEFADSLSALDEGLNSQPEHRTAGRPPLLRVAPNEPPIVTQPGSKRRLLDLFPDESVAVPPESPTLPARGVAPAPQLVRPIGPRRVPAQPAPPPHTYETFYGLSEAPFLPGPDPRFLYRSVAHDQAAEALLDAIHRRAGVVVLTAPLGHGKTTLCRAVLDRLDRRTLTSLVSEPIVSFQQLASTLLVDFGELSRADVRQQSDRAELVRTLRSLVASLHSRQTSAVVVIDEAQSLPTSVLRQIATFVSDAPVQLVLSGRPDLTSRLSLGELQTLRNQIGTWIELGPLVADEVPGYVMHRLSVAGRQPRIEFDDEALGQLFEYSQGSPQIVNQLCDRALTRGFDRSASVITAELVLVAAGELGFSTASTQTDASTPWIPIVVAALALMGLGAAAAAWIFSDRLHQIIAAWR